MDVVQLVKKSVICLKICAKTAENIYTFHRLFPSHIELNIHIRIYTLHFVNNNNNNNSYNNDSANDNYGNGYKIGSNSSSTIIYYKKNSQKMKLAKSLWTSCSYYSLLTQTTLTHSQRAYIMIWDDSIIGRHTSNPYALNIINDFTWARGRSHTIIPELLFFDFFSLLKDAQEI